MQTIISGDTAMDGVHVVIQYCHKSIPYSTKNKKIKALLYRSRLKKV